MQTLKKYKKQKQSQIETKHEIKGTDVTVEMHKLALPIEESIVLVNIEDIVYVGLVDGKSDSKNNEGNICNTRYTCDFGKEVAASKFHACSS